MSPLAALLLLPAWWWPFTRAGRSGRTRLLRLGHGRTLGRRRRRRRRGLAARCARRARRGRRHRHHVLTARRDACTELRPARFAFLPRRDDRRRDEDR